MLKDGVAGGRERSTVILQVLDANLSTVGQVVKLSNAIEGRHMAVGFWKRPVRLSRSLGGGLF